MDFVAPTNHRVKIKESEKRDKYLDLTREIKKPQKTVEHDGDGDTNCNRYARNNLESLVNEQEDL